MSNEPSEEQRLALANLHALAQATLKGSARAERDYLDALADYAPDAETLREDDPRSSAALGQGVEPAAAKRRFAAKLRGVALGVAAHRETPRGELGALARAVVGGEGVDDAAVEERSWQAVVKTREDLVRDVVRLGDGAIALEGDAGARARRWGGVRSLELNAFVAAFTREGMHPQATRATREGRDAAALRFALAVTQAALSLPAGTAPGAPLVRDIDRTERALPALIANLAATLRAG